MEQNAAALAFQSGMVPEEKIILKKDVEQSLYAVVFVGDLLTATQKKSPRWRLGGKLFPYPDFQTVPDNIVPRCAITRLKSVMRGVHKGQIEEDKWGLYTDSFTLTDQWDAAKQEFVTITVGEDGSSRDLLYKALSPKAEVGMITDREDNPGVVLLTGDAELRTGEEIRAAQLHYFPDWLDILMGSKKLPVRIAELEAHIADRQAATLSPQFKAVGDALLESCTKFREWSKRYIDTQTDAIETWKGKGVTVRYDEIGERLFTVCDLTREDKMITNFAKDQISNAQTSKDLATAITMMAQLLARQNAGALAALPAAENQAPVPQTTEEAAQEFSRATGGEVFVDMTKATVPEVTVEDDGLNESLSALGEAVDD